MASRYLTRRVDLVGPQKDVANKHGIPRQDQDIREASAQSPDTEHLLVLESRRARVYSVTQVDLLM